MYCTIAGNLKDTNYYYKINIRLFNNSALTSNNFNNTNTNIIGANFRNTNDVPIN